MNPKHNYNEDNSMGVDTIWSWFGYFEQSGLIYNSNVVLILMLSRIRNEEGPNEGQFFMTYKTTLISIEYYYWIIEYHIHQMIVFNFQFWKCILQEGKSSIFVLSYDKIIIYKVTFEYSYTYPLSCLKCLMEHENLRLTLDTLVMTT